MTAVLPIYDVTPFTLQDFPDRAACIVWFAGCNMRCAYCHNPQIVKGKAGKIAAEDVFRFLETRKGLLDGVVLSGGEATLYRDLPSFARAIKKMGFALKLDTNGTRPAIMRALLKEGLLDYIALDYKAPDKKFSAITGLRIKNPFDETLDLLCRQNAVPVEIRTTVHTAQLDEDDINGILKDLKARGFQGKYYIQGYTAPAGGTLGNLGAQDRAFQASRVNCSIGIDTGYRNIPV